MSLGASNFLSYRLNHIHRYACLIKPKTLTKNENSRLFVVMLTKTKRVACQQLHILFEYSGRSSGKNKFRTEFEIKITFIYAQL